MAKIPDETLNENDVLEFIDVLTRTTEINKRMIDELADNPNVGIIKRDNEVLLDIRNRIWKQFTPILVDVLN